ncbi:ATP-dependent DNA helicase [Glaciimonas sp. PAMC28666]|uniref:ATP-dependent DNA helicase n=1 Tax=Glaciimonas sp. PAMC28666 TaxID=2807626 RepID=UPI001962FC73|nr:ATP-dependent DNA helicase [Glaciimonas sp. PAMC28666]QRX85093.1 ATP-dependent DNA helicase [Glaciimonas sp. PAMC28666]
MTYVVAVRNLCEFTAKCGDLDLRFTPSPSAQDGIAGHGIVRARRKKSYQSEISLSGEAHNLRVTGRADGYDPDKNQLEEIKTYRGDFNQIPNNHRQLHWAQVKIYGWLFCQERGLSEVRLALVYFDIGSQQETEIAELHTADALKIFFDNQCERFSDWADRELLHRASRDQALNALQFPHAVFRQGQRALAEDVYRATTSGRCLMVQAPTGIGKTIGTIFPTLKACPKQGLDKIFFLTAKTSGRNLALDALKLIKNSASALPLRVLELVARDKACEYPDKACHGDSCPLAKGFYDRLPMARKSAVSAHAMDKAAIRAVALEHQVCPYYLSQDLVRWSDVVVGDYNYYFDLNAMLYGLTVANQWRVTVLVDEAHNMVERARQMYSAELEQGDLKRARRDSPPGLKKTLERFNRQWNALHKNQTTPYLVVSAIPPAFINAMQQTISTVSEYLNDTPVGLDSSLLRFYFDLLHFSHMAALFDSHSLFDVSKNTEVSGSRAIQSGVSLCLRNIIPGPFLAQRFAAARSVILFSATLTPSNFYSDTLGLPADTAWIDVQSPFGAEQLSVHIGDISTRYKDREKSLEPIVGLMGNTYNKMEGNYLAFFSSFDYLQNVADLFANRYPDTPVWIQSRRMGELEREQFLARFSSGSKGIGFAVLGGAFAEGIDLPGDCLIGAFIATLGLPPLNPVNNQMMQCMSATFGSDLGYDYTYLFPGIRKVVQAAGRVIRTQLDRGTIHLIDDRFTDPKIVRLLPKWWALEN